MLLCAKQISETFDVEIKPMMRAHREQADGESPAEMRLGKWTTEGKVKGGVAPSICDEGRR